MFNPPSRSIQLSAASLAPGAGGVQIVRRDAGEDPSSFLLANVSTTTDEEGVTFRGPAPGQTQTEDDTEVLEMSNGDLWSLRESIPLGSVLQQQSGSLGSFPFSTARPRDGQAEQRRKDGIQTALQAVYLSRKFSLVQFFDIERAWESEGADGSVVETVKGQNEHTDNELMSACEMAGALYTPQVYTVTDGAEAAQEILDDDEGVSIEARRDTLSQGSLAIPPDDVSVRFVRRFTSAEAFLSQTLTGRALTEARVTERLQTYLKGERTAMGRSFLPEVRALFEGVETDSGRGSVCEFEADVLPDRFQPPDCTLKLFIGPRKAICVSERAQSCISGANGDCGVFVEEEGGENQVGDQEEDKKGGTESSESEGGRGKGCAWLFRRCSDFPLVLQWCLDPLLNRHRDFGRDPAHFFLARVSVFSSEKKGQTDRRDGEAKEEDQPPGFTSFFVMQKDPVMGLVLPRMSFGCLTGTLRDASGRGGRVIRQGGDEGVQSNLRDITRQRLLCDFHKPMSVCQMVGWSIFQQFESAVLREVERWEREGTKAQQKETETHGGAPKCRGTAACGGEKEARLEGKATSREGKERNGNACPPSHPLASPDFPTVELLSLIAAEMRVSEEQDVNASGDVEGERMEGSTGEKEEEDQNCTGVPRSFCPEVGLATVNGSPQEAETEKPREPEESLHLWSFLRKAIGERVFEEEIQPLFSSGKSPSDASLFDQEEVPQVQPSDLRTFTARFEGSELVPSLLGSGRLRREVRDLGREQRRALLAALSSLRLSACVVLSESSGSLFGLVGVSSTEIREFQGEAAQAPTASTQTQEGEAEPLGIASPCPNRNNFRENATQQPSLEKTRDVGC
uniref:Uncharacterized protein n=1 Tax=Chromera velia CCMP2878 TaxID=1169474 RepID=A0A0G4FQ45_9ALVE|eukprot:Cvel_18010.t1-p1 / transcript=Cvel_18010.t1 / gene=Cvel_18010 / organism=Chromera_velia_CCMP2878 / gene_product=hypothetical protein / transcript_product=hypothetical protein / location=Cvel_scaffold1469:7451-12271(-) / protein_length=852 / sequence_SO=supercontig / SO=protein_coding / is_pseudo=false